VGTNKVLGVGAGYRLNRVYADIAYQYMIVDEGYLPYPSLDADGFNRPERELFMTNEYRPSKVMLTLGIKL